MARPLKQGLDYFPHDTDAINDKKIQRLIAKLGLAGYGFYFALLADIYAELPEPYKWSENKEIFSRKCHQFLAKSERTLKVCVELKLFDGEKFAEDSTLISPGIVQRADAILKAREAKRKQRLSSSLSSSLSIDLSKDCPTTKHNNKSIIDKSIIVEEKKKEEEKGNSATAKIFKVYEDNFHTLTPLVSDKLKDFIETYGEERVTYALNEAVDHNARSIAYIEKVLEGGGSSSKSAPGDAPAYLMEGVIERVSAWKQDE